MTQDDRLKLRVDEAYARLGGLTNPDAKLIRALWEQVNEYKEEVEDSKPEQFTIDEVFDIVQDEFERIVEQRRYEVKEREEIEKNGQATD